MELKRKINILEEELEYEYELKTKPTEKCTVKVLLDNINRAEKYIECLEKAIIIANL